MGHGTGCKHSETLFSFCSAHVSAQEADMNGFPGGRRSMRAHRSPKSVRHGYACLVCCKPRGSYVSGKRYGGYRDAIGVCGSQGLRDRSTKELSPYGNVSYAHRSIEKLEYDLLKTEAVLIEDSNVESVSVETEEEEDSVITVKKKTVLESLGEVVPSRVRGLIMLNLLVLLCATNWVVVKDAGSSFDPYAFASLRFGVAALLFSPVLMDAMGETTIVKAGVEIGFWTACGYLFQAQGLLTTDASRASFLSTFTVLVVPFLAGFAGQKVKPLTWFSALAALVGVSMLEQSGSPASIGDVWSALSAIAFGIQIFRTEHWSKSLRGKENALSLMSIVLFSTAALSTVAAGVMHWGDIASFVGSVDQIHRAEWGGMLENIPWSQVFYTGFLTTDAVLLMEMLALQDVSSMEAAIIYTLEPVLGAGLAFVVLGERWGTLGWFGATLIVTSCLATQVWGQQHNGEEESGAT